VPDLIRYSRAWRLPRCENDIVEAEDRSTSARLLVKTLGGFPASNVTSGPSFGPSMPEFWDSRCDLLPWETHASWRTEETVAHVRLAL
jgi:hypothetical protein